MAERVSGMNQCKSRVEFLAYHRGGLANQIYIIARGVRKVALVVAHEPGVFEEEIKATNAHHASIRVRYREVRFGKSYHKYHKSYVVFGYRYEQEALALKREFEKPGRNHRKIGRLLGYSEEAIDNFMRQQ